VHSERGGIPFPMLMRMRPIAGTGRSFQSFHWRNSSPREESDMSSAKTTTNHDEIRKWVEKHGGHPAVVAATENKGGGGLLRIDYDEPGGNDDDRLHRITWNEFFEIFDKNDIAFLYDPDGDSRFSKFVEKTSANS
jgi:hypothetical protein